MSTNYFVGRESELKQLDQSLFNGAPKATELNCVLISGRQGIGKTELLKQFTQNLEQESKHTIWFHPESNTGYNQLHTFYSAVVKSAKTNYQPLESYVEKLILESEEFNVTRGETESPESFWKGKFENYLLPAGASTQIQDLLDDVHFIFILDDFANVPRSILKSFADFIKHLTAHKIGRQQVGLILSSESYQSDTLMELDLNDTQKYHEIKLAPFTQQECEQLLDSEDFEQHIIDKVFEQTLGHPADIVACINDQKMRSENQEAILNRGSNLVSQYSDIERKWLYWAAIAKVCKKEIIGIFADNDEQNDCLNWIRSKHPTLFENTIEGYRLNRDLRKAVIAYLEQKEPEFYIRLKQKMDNYQSVCMIIPSEKHRKALSILMSFNVFEISVIKKVFNEEISQSIINLIDEKPDYFRKSKNLIRMSSNVRNAIIQYNELLPQDPTVPYKSRIAHYWEQKEAKLNQQLVDLEKDIKESSEQTNKLNNSIVNIEKEISRIKSLSKKATPIIPKHTAPTHYSLSGVIGIVTFQVIGVILLYIGILYYEDISLTYIGLAAICILAGFIFSPGKHEQKVKEALEVGNIFESEQKFGKLIHNLEVDRNSLVHMQNKENSSIRSHQQTIQKIQEELKQPYLMD